MRPVSKVDYASACGVSRNAVYKAIARGDVVERPDGKIDLDNSTNMTYQKHCLQNVAATPPPKKAPKSPKKDSKPANKKKKSIVDKDQSNTKIPPKPDAEKGRTEPKSATETSNAQATLDYDDLDLNAMDPELANMLMGGTGDRSKWDVDKFKVIEEIKNKIQARAKERGELIKRDLVREVFGHLWVVDTTEFKTLGIRLAPDIASLVQTHIEDIRNEEPEYKDSPILTRVNEFINSTDFMRSINERTTTEVIKTLDHIKRIMDKFLVNNGAEPVADDLIKTQEPELTEVKG
jgi:hypothetical protein